MSKSAEALAAETLAAAVGRAEAQSDPVLAVKEAILARMKKGSRVLASRANRLATKAIPGFKQRWVAKDESEIGRRIEQGYVTVNRESGLPMDIAEVPSQALGSSVERTDLVLMATPNELVEERLRDQQELVDRSERTMKRTLQAKTGLQNMDGKIQIKDRIRTIE